MHSLLLLPAMGLVLTAASLGQNAGISFCAPTNNSTGASTVLTGSFGSGTGSDLHLEVTDGVPGEFGYFLAGNEATSGVVVSNGLLCIVGSPTAQMFRYNIAGGGQNSSGVFDNSGVFQNSVGTSLVGSGFDVPDAIPASLPTPILAGDTWHFQFWHRDTPAGLGSSNFSNGLSISFWTGPVPVAGMVSIPAGSFDMGSNASSGAPYYNNSNQQPVHNVTIDVGFWIGETEVTQGQYQALMGTNPSYFSGMNRPVDTVSWNDARAYCTALTAQEMATGNLPAGYEYRLPTEAEWEYACRAGTTTEFNVGAALLCVDAHFNYSAHSSNACGTAGTNSVGGYAANAFGLYDMHGNVYELCLDSHAAYSGTSQTDPFVTGGSQQIIRGGAWDYDSYECSSAYRHSAGPNDAYSDLGFRVVLASVLVP
ncbi:MAG: formylglycine-generating enzyme family protein [bacterium]|nr:formylglycine-generating enzyme family protein [bacterium]